MNHHKYMGILQRLDASRRWPNRAQWLRIIGLISVNPPGTMASLSSSDSHNYGAMTRVTKEKIEFNPAIADYARNQPWEVDATLWEKVEDIMGGNPTQPPLPFAPATAPQPSTPSEPSLASTGAWIFQANPRIFDIRAAVETLHSLTWTCRQQYYLRRLQTGDAVYIWESGKNAGIVARGHISAAPAITAVDEEEAVFYREEAGMDEQMRVRVDIDAHFLPPIPKQFLAEDRTLARHRIITAPMGTVFPLSAEEARALEQRIAVAPPSEGERASYVPPSFEAIRAAVAASGQRVDERTLRRYHLGLATRKFVILAGISGTGKTWLATNYARAVNADYAVVPVAPNWTSNEDLLGYYNPVTDRYCPTAFFDMLQAAADEERDALRRNAAPRPCHVILDEMNLARVEYYFARFLSLMEQRQRGEEALLELGPGRTLALPGNLYFIGTVNMDETTNGFADKVFDRAQLIELSADRDALKAHLMEKAWPEEWADFILRVWDAVHDTAPFAFRVLDDMHAYISAATGMGTDWREALEDCLLQKILPRIKGNDPRVKAALENLLEPAAEKGMSLVRARLELMLGQWKQYGFTSFFA
jgi:hypothetical protein